MPILSELASSKNKNKTIITPTAVSTLLQTALDELILPPVLVPQLQVAASTPSTSAIDKPIHVEEGTKHIPKDETEPVSLEMFNKAASDLNNKGIINLKKYNQYLVKKSSKPIYFTDPIMSYTASDKLPEDFFSKTIEEKAKMIRKYLKDVGNLLVFSTHIGLNMATFKFYSPNEEDSLKLHYLSNLGDLKEQLYFLWVQLNYVLKGE